MEPDVRFEGRHCVAISTHEQARNILGRSHVEGVLGWSTAVGSAGTSFPSPAIHESFVSKQDRTVRSFIRVFPAGFWLQTQLQGTRSPMLRNVCSRIMTLPENGRQLGPAAADLESSSTHRPVSARLVTSAPRTAMHKLRRAKGHGPEESMLRGGRFTPEDHGQNLQDNVRHSTRLP